MIRIYGSFKCITKSIELKIGFRNENFKKHKTYQYYSNYISEAENGPTPGVTYLT